ncbi:hypothetical protein RRF57_006030 [Xylaria bambusicola]|uniref:Uncharacterized protein n=1 Tax=Xylaria bambusicola TaxID=326684 RepID=A0AAN7UDM1_9PEZI
MPLDRSRGGIRNAVQKTLPVTSHRAGSAMNRRRCRLRWRRFRRSHEKKAVGFSVFESVMRWLFDTTGLPDSVTAWIPGVAASCRLRRLRRQSPSKHHVVSWEFRDDTADDTADEKSRC